MKIDFSQPRFTGARFDEHTLPVILSREELNRLVFSTASPASLITACFLLDRVLAGAVYA